MRFACARDGWRLLGDHRFDPACGRWIHCTGVVGPPLRLGDVKYDDSGTHRATPRRTSGEELLAHQLREGAEILRTEPEPDLTPPGSVSDDFEHLRWFGLPGSAIH